MPAVGGPISPGVSERWFRALYESPLMFSGILDAGGRVVDANRLSVEGCGLVRTEVMGRPFWECGWWSPDPGVARRIREWFEAVLATGEPLRARSRYFLGDGTPRMVDLALHPVVDDNATSDAVAYIVATGSDITDALATQAAREERMNIEASALRRSEDLFRGALDAMIDNVAIGRSIRGDTGAIVDFELEFLNQASVDGAGRPAPELAGARVCDVYPGWRTSGMFDRFSVVVETGEPFVGYRVPYRDALDDGTPIEGYWDLQVVKLGDGYIAASRDVTQAVKDEETLRQAAHVAERERVAVDVLQRAALPTQLPRTPGVLLGAQYLPTMGDAGVGGDWYDAFELDSSHLALVIADVAGHGSDAAAYMVQIRNVMRAVAVDSRDPGDILRRVNHVALRLDDVSAPFITCCVIVVDHEHGLLTGSLAGHPPPLTVAADGSTSFFASPPGPPLGVLRDAHYSSDPVTTRTGDRIVMYTDGLIERRGESFDDGMVRLAAMAASSRNLGPQAAAEMLASTLSAQRDDVAILVVDFDDTRAPREDPQAVDSASSRASP